MQTADIEISRESWKPVFGYEGIYSVSNLGRVRREKAGLGSRVGRIVTPVILDQKKGYHILNLCHEGRCKTRLVHQLVAHAFIGPCPEGMEIDHKDSCTINNRVDNLRYLTSKENSSQPGSKNAHAKLTEDDVFQIRNSYRTGQHTHRSLARIFKVDRALIGRVIRKQSWKHI